MRENELAVVQALAKLSAGQWQSAIEHSRSELCGGRPIAPGALRTRLEELGLVFNSTGRLRPLALAALGGTI